MSTHFAIFILALLLAVIRSVIGTLSVDFYNQTCPNVESFVLAAVKKAAKRDLTVPAGLLRMHFHDCFIEGCDGSVLIDSTPGNQAEKDGPPNLSLHGFYVIDNAKAKIETACPETVSCADILAIAARDAVVLSGGPHWEVLKGRKDGRISNASDTINLPAPTFNVSQLTQSFALRNLSQFDMVTLSGGHTLGFSHCSSFNKRLFNFNSSNEIDPTMSHRFGTALRRKCPENNTNHSAGTFLDSSKGTFDNKYFIDIVEGRGIFSSDQDLFTDPQTKEMVITYAQNEHAFFSNFGNSMVRMGNAGIKTDADGEIRVKCRIVNPPSSSSFQSVSV
eukprot:c25007_g1_i1 orf=58-1059(+)